MNTRSSASLMICADPGARAHTMAAWLLNELKIPAFDIGRTNRFSFQKLHTDFGNHAVTEAAGPKIRIQTGTTKLWLHLYLFLHKNVYTQIPQFSRDPFDLETMTKLTESAKFWLEHNQQLNEDLYDYVYPFEQTYELDAMTDLYYLVNQKYPSREYVNLLGRVNEKSTTVLDLNHACHVTAMVLHREAELGLEEAHRFWSVPVVYDTTARDRIYATIFAAIDSINYGVDLNKI